MELYDERNGRRGSKSAAVKMMTLLNPRLLLSCIDHFHWRSFITVVYVAVINSDTDIQLAIGRHILHVNEVF